MDEILNPSSAKQASSSTGFELQFDVLTFPSQHLFLFFVYFSHKTTFHFVNNPQKNYEYSGQNSSWGKSDFHNTIHFAKTQIFWNSNRPVTG